MFMVFCLTYPRIACSDWAEQRSELNFPEKTGFGVRKKCAVVIIKRSELQRCPVTPEKTCVFQVFYMPDKSGK